MTYETKRPDYTQAMALEEKRARYRAELSPDDREFLAWEHTSRDVIDVKRVYVDLTGDLVAGILLSQLVYWWLPAKNGQSKLEVVDKEGRFWLAKGREEWWEECRITPKQFDRASDLLAEKGFAVKRVGRFRGETRVHLSLNIPELHQAVKRELTKAENRTSPKGNSGLPETVNPRAGDHYSGSKTTSETTYAAPAATAPETPKPPAGAVSTSGGISRQSPDKRHESAAPRVPANATPQNPQASGQGEAPAAVPGEWWDTALELLIFVNGRRTTLSDREIQLLRELHGMGLSLAGLVEVAKREYASLQARKPGDRISCMAAFLAAPWKQRALQERDERERQAAKARRYVTAPDPSSQPRVSPEETDRLLLEGVRATNPAMYRRILRDRQYAEAQAKGTVA